MAQLYYACVFVGRGDGSCECTGKRGGVPYFFLKDNSKKFGVPMQYTLNMLAGL